MLRFSQRSRRAAVEYGWASHAKKPLGAKTRSGFISLKLIAYAPAGTGDGETEGPPADNSRETPCISAVASPAMA